MISMKTAPTAELKLRDYPLSRVARTFTVEPHGAQAEGKQANTCQPAPIIW